MAIEPVVVVSVCATLISLLSLFIAIQNHKMSIVKWKGEYFAAFTNWSNEAMPLFSEALHICELDQNDCEESSFLNSLYLLRIKLWAHVDKGRWLFPNIYTDQYGQHKEPAFRGHRHEVLDQLVFGYRAVSAIKQADIKENELHRNDIQKARRKFTSYIQEMLDPASRDAEFKKLTKSKSVANKVRSEQS